MPDRNALEVAYFLAQITAAGVAIAALLILSHQTALLRRQIRESNRTQRTSQYQAALQLMFDWRSDIINNKDLAARLIDSKGGSPYFQEMLEKHGVQSFFHTLKMFHVFEVYFILNRERVIDTDMWEGWKRNIAVLMTPQLNQELWVELKLKHAFNRTFEDFMDDIVKGVTPRSESARDQA